MLHKMEVIVISVVICSAIAYTFKGYMIEFTVWEITKFVFKSNK